MKDFIQSILNNVNKIINYNYSNYELFLNITFLIIVFIISYIIYYYYINRTAFLNSTCKSRHLFLIFTISNAHKGSLNNKCIIGFDSSLKNSFHLESLKV
jgi:hypothetical protein